jgi:membrane protein implicated in regulation of membrane protease activity
VVGAHNTEGADVMWCHVLLFGLPVLGLPLFWIFPLPLALALYLPLSAVSVWLGVVVTRTLRLPVGTGVEALRGRSGRVVTVDRWSALVQLDGEGELWRAICSEPLALKQAVDILDVEGLTLIVGAAHPAGTDPGRGSPPGRAGADPSCHRRSSGRTRWSWFRSTPTNA